MDLDDFAVVLGTKVLHLVIAGINHQPPKVRVIDHAVQDAGPDTMIRPEANRRWAFFQTRNLAASASMGLRAPYPEHGVLK